MNDTDAPGYFQVENTLVARHLRIMGRNGFSVYVYLLMRAQRTVYAWPKGETIAEVTGLQRRTVGRALARLCRLRYLRPCNGPPWKIGRSQCYEILPLPCTPLEGIPGVLANTTTADSATAHGVRSNCAPRAQLAAHPVPISCAPRAQEELVMNSTQGRGDVLPPIPAPSEPPERPLDPFSASQMANLFTAIDPMYPTSRPAGYLAEISVQLAELLRQGVPAAFLMDQIQDPTRDRLEWFSAFRGRLKSRLAGYKAADTLRRTREKQAAERSQRAEISPEERERVRQDLKELRRRLDCGGPNDTIGTAGTERQADKRMGRITAKPSAPPAGSVDS